MNGKLQVKCRLNLPHSFPVHTIFMIVVKKTACSKLRCNKNICHARPIQTGQFVTFAFNIAQKITEWLFGPRNSYFSLKTISEFNYTIGTTIFIHQFLVCFNIINPFGFIH